MFGSLWAIPLYLLMLGKSISARNVLMIMVMYVTFYFASLLYIIPSQNERGLLIGVHQSIGGCLRTLPFCTLASGLNLDFRLDSDPNLSRNLDFSHTVSPYLSGLLDVLPHLTSFDRPGNVQAKYITQSRDCQGLPDGILKYANTLDLEMSGDAVNDIL